MSDFYDILMAQPEEEAKEIALSLELFVNGSLNIFNHQTNVDVDNRFVVYGIRDLGTELSPITMLVMMESIQQRIVENGKKGKATWLYIDEFHVLLNSEYSAKYLQQLWKKVRKQGGFAPASRRMSWIYYRTIRLQQCLQTVSLWHFLNRQIQTASRWQRLLECQMHSSAS